MEWKTRTLYDPRKGIDFNQIYFPKDVGTIEDFQGKEMNKILFRIINSKFDWNDVGCGDNFKYILKLDLVKADNKRKKPSYPYLLDGSIPSLAFIVNMDTDILLSLKYNRPIKALHGKEVYGFVSKDLENESKNPKHAENGIGVIEAIALRQW